MRNPIPFQWIACAVLFTGLGFFLGSRPWKERKPHPIPIIQIPDDNPVPFLDWYIPEGTISIHSEAGKSGIQPLAVLKMGDRGFLLGEDTDATRLLQLIPTGVDGIRFKETNRLNK